MESGRPFTLFAGENTFGDVAGLLDFLDFVDGVAAVGADADAPFLGHFAHGLDEVLAAFLRKGRDGQPDELAVDQGRDAELRFFEGLADGVDGGAVPGLDEDEA